uniref:Translation initiation factor 2, beta subunit (eIF-2beta)/eIF-5 N-terminal domain n=1 Tax=Clandestinovirus TaxID=2831644 RepID=A0A8F8KLY0_9VIRU|nr:translation initiation factor 2, beta subunit (eIF-2beta)/eIF-5 N-terminal domain [Clandestinovirus]
MQPEISISCHIRIARISRRTLIIGSDDLLRQYRRSSEHFASFLSKQVGASCSVSEEDDNIISLPFPADRAFAVQYFQDYIRKRVQCFRCKTLDTVVGKFARTQVLLCFNCGNRVFDWSE